MKLFDGMTATRKAEVMAQLKAVWTHDSTAIEGNTLTLGDTMFVLGYGLTVKGKPLKDQIDIQNHARAIDRVMELFVRGRVEEEDLFALHRLLINEQPTDIYKPIGAYKREDNGTYYPDPNGRSVYHKYLPADDVPEAMTQWIAAFNARFKADATREELIAVYALSHAELTAIHPFYDGNGRLARLVANLPVLFAGEPPIVIPKESREDYLNALRAYEQGGLEPLKKIVAESWSTTIALFDGAR